MVRTGVTMVVVVLLVAATCGAMPFDEDSQNGSILLTTRDGQVIWLKRHPTSLLQGMFNFNVSVDFGVTDQPKALAVGDFDGDANGDVLIARSGGDLGNPNIGYLTWVERAPQPPGAPNDTLTGVHNFNVSPANSIAIGEMGDGLHDDVVVGRDDNYITWSYKNPAADQITAYHTWNAGAPIDLAIGDFDGDENGDVLIAGTNGFLVWAERSSMNTLTGVHSFETSPANSIAMGDADGNGLDDVFVGRDDGYVTWAFKSPTSDQITSDSAVGSFNAGGVIDLAFGDAGGDGMGDIFVARPDGTILWLVANPAAHNMSAVASALAAGLGASLTAIGAGDLDGNGYLDIVVGRDDGVGTGSVGWFEAIHDDPGGPIISVVQDFFNVGTPVLDLQLASVPVLPGDCDGDGDVDLDDYIGFESCLLGPGGGVGIDCDCYDTDGSGDVDLGDFATFQESFTG